MATVPGWAAMGRPWQEEEEEEGGEEEEKEKKDKEKEEEGEGQGVESDSHRGISVGHFHRAPGCRQREAMRPVFVFRIGPSGSGWEAAAGWWPQLGGKGKSHAGGLKTVTLKYGVTPLRLPGRAGPLLPRKELVERKTCEPPEEVWSLRLGNVHLFFKKRKKRTSQPNIYTPSGSHRQTMLSG